MTIKQAKEYVSNPFIVIFRGFGDLFNHNQTMAIVILVFSMLGSFMQFANPFPFAAPGASIGTSTAPTSNNGTTSFSSVLLPIILVTIFVILLIAVAIFISTIYRGVVAYVALKTSRKETVTFEEAIRVTMKKFWTIVLVDVIVGLKVFGGMLLFIIPGIRAMLRYNMVRLTIFDKDAKASEAISYNKQITKDHLIEVFGMTTAASLMPLIGGILQVGGQSIMYKQLSELKTSGAQKPPVHWLNYLGFILLGALFLFIGLILLLVVALSNY